MQHTLVVDITQDGSPQLQALGQFHLPHFPQYKLQAFVALKGMNSCTKVLSETLPRGAPIVHEYFRVHPIIHDTDSTPFFGRSMPLQNEFMFC